MDVRQRIFDWSVTEPAWRRDLLRRVAVDELDDQGALEVLDLVLGEHGLAPTAPTASPLVLDDLPADAPATPDVLYAIGECSNVGAIASEAPLTFEPSGITLVYGDNTVGKSSYARIIKRIARAAHTESILSNVFTSAGASPRAVIDLENANGRTTHIVPLGDAGKPLLDSMTVFDRACAGVYLRKEKTVAFTPTPLQIFARAVKGQRLVRELLEGRIAALTSRRPNFDAFDASTVVGRELDTLAATTDVDKLRALSELTEEERERRGQAQFELAAVDAGALESQARQRERDGSQLDVLAAELDALAARVSVETEERLLSRRAQSAQANEAVALARAALAGEALPGTGSQAWLRMWEATRAYVERECEHPFPPTNEGALCPLCQQVLADSARTRLESLEQHVESTLERELTEAEVAFAQERKAVDAVDIAPVLDAPGYALLEDDYSELSERIAEWLHVASARAVALASGDVAPLLERPPSELVREIAAARRAEAARRRRLGNEGELDALRREVAELLARELLSERWMEVEEWLGVLRTIDALGGVHKALGTTGLSLQQTELAKEVVTNELRRLVRAELDALGFSHLKVDLNCRTDKGSTVARMSLAANAAVADVLSESEQSGCALAFFLSESLASGSEGGVVFDDPATSFDVARVDHIARRIAELAAKRRQVIVFTHNAVFAWCLREAAKHAGVEFGVRPITRMGDRVGIVRHNQVWPGETLKECVKRLRTTLQQLEAMWSKNDLVRYEPAAKTFAGDIREGWERAIEDGLFRGVVKRFQRDVQALKIRDVEVTKTQTQEVYDGMTETSPFHHSASLAKPVPTPTLDELKTFFGRLERFCDSLKKSEQAKSARRSA